MLEIQQSEYITANIVRQEVSTIDDKDQTG